MVVETLAREELVDGPDPPSLSTRRCSNGPTPTAATPPMTPALVEALGGRVVVVPGETTNVKITHLGDLERPRRKEPDVENRPGH